MGGSELQSLPEGRVTRRGQGLLLCKHLCSGACSLKEQHLQVTWANVESSQYLLIIL